MSKMLAHKSIWNAALEDIATGVVLGFSEEDCNLLNEFSEEVWNANWKYSNDDYCMHQLFFALMLGSEMELDHEKNLVKIINDYIKV